MKNAHRRISTMVMWNFGGVLTLSARWHVDNDALLGHPGQPGYKSSSAY